jgi:hypothetical protein
MESIPISCVHKSPLSKYEKKKIILQLPFQGCGIVNLAEVKRSGKYKITSYSSEVSIKHRWTFLLGRTEERSWSKCTEQMGSNI